MQLPSRFAPIVFSLIVSLTMSCIVAGISTFSTIFFSDGFFTSWMVAWGKSWPIAFPTLLTVVPMARKLMNVFLDPSSRLEPIIFALFVQIMMSFIISGVSTHSAISFSEAFIASWMSSWGKSLTVTYPILLIVFPMARKIVSVCVLPPDLPDQRPHA